MKMRHYTLEHRRESRFNEGHNTFGKTILITFAVLALMQLIGGHVQNRFILVGFFGIGLILRGGRRK